MAKVGQSAPVWSNKQYIQGQSVQTTLSLSDFAGQKVIMAFFPGLSSIDWANCVEVQTLNTHYSDLAGSNASAVAVTIVTASDPQTALLNWMTNITGRTITDLPVMADTDSTVTTSYGAMNFTGTAPNKALFILDSSHNIVFKSVIGLTQNANTTWDEMKRILDQCS